MAKATISNLDAGQLDFMWNMLKLGGFKPSSADVRCMIENTDAVRQAFIQKSGGHDRRSDPKEYVRAEDIGTHINLIVLSALSLRVSGVLDQLLETMERTDGS